MHSCLAACGRRWGATAVRCLTSASTTCSASTMVAACERVGVPLDRIEDIVAGCVNPAHEGMGDIARWAALAAGFPDSVPAITVNRFCASSLSGAISIAHAIRSDELSVGLAAGVESMSRSGWALMKGDAPFMPRGPGVHARHDVGRRGRPAQPRAAGPQRLHRDDADGAERGRPLRAHARGDRRLRAALSPARGRGARLGPSRRRDPSRRDPGHPQGARADLRARREHPRRHDARRSSRPCRRSRTPPR